MTERLAISFVIVGVQKAATSTLSALLRSHPQVARARRKELHFFDDESRDWENPDYSEYAANRTKAHQVIAGDATPSYLFWPTAFERMHRYDPSLKLIASFRDPIERAFSQWMMQVDRRGAALEEFDDLVRAGLGVEDPTMPPWKSGPLRNRAIVARGFYGHQLRRATSYFPAEQWLMLDFLDVVKRQEVVKKQMTDFLGLDEFAPVEEGAVKHQTNPAPGRPGPSAEVLRDLAKAYEADLAEFAALSGLDVSRWATRRLLTGALAAEALAAKLAAKVEGS